MSSSEESQKEDVNVRISKVVEAVRNLDIVQMAPDIQNATYLFYFKRTAIRAIDWGNLLEIPTGEELRFEEKFEDFHRKLKGKFEIGGPFFWKKPDTPCELRSPLHIAKLLHVNRIDDHVVKLFQKQFEVKWHTKTGIPDQFSFYRFCQAAWENKVGNIDTLLNYKIRKEHVMASLYQAQAELHKIRDMHSKALCPPVYIRARKEETMYEWVKWTWEKDEKKLVWAAGTNINIEWITNKFLKSHIESTAFQENSSDSSRTFPTKQYGGHLYWAVFEEEDLETDLLGKAQVYVGIAANGIIDRWMGDSKSHCAMMRESRDVARNIINYDPNVLKGKQLVDLRLLLHKARHPDGRNSGIFIMGVEEELEKQIKQKILQLEVNLKDMEKKKLELEENLKGKTKEKRKRRQEKLKIANESSELKTLEQTIEMKIKELNHEKSEVSRLGVLAYFEREAIREGVEIVLNDGKTWKLHPKDMKHGMNAQ